MGAVLGAGATYLAYKNRKKIAEKMWKIKARAQLHRRLSNLKRITKKEYEELVDAVLSKYEDLESISRYEIDEFADELKDRWDSVKERIDEAAAVAASDD